MACGLRGYVPTRDHKLLGYRMRPYDGTLPIKTLAELAVERTRGTLLGCYGVEQLVLRYQSE